MNQAAIANRPKVPYAHRPTPLEPLSLLSAKLGRPGLWIKRDDCTGLATGGNKTRKLEYLIGAALAEGANCVLTMGAIQSNHVRQTAAACRRVGLECHAVLGKVVTWPDAEYQNNGNVLLDRLFEAHIHLAEGNRLFTTAKEIGASLRESGRSLYVIPPGGSTAIGALGYAECVTEIFSQAAGADFHPDLIVHASSSGGTQAGLIAGVATARAKTRVLGINIGDKQHAEMAERVFNIAREAVAIVEPGFELTEKPWIDNRYHGDYGIPTPETIAAIRLLASTEAILLDPVYTGKGMGGFLDMLKRGELDEFKNIVFVHTGGAATLSAYPSAFA